MVILVALPFHCQEGNLCWEQLQWRVCSGDLNWSLPKSSVSLSSFPGVSQVTPLNPSFQSRYYLFIREHETQDIFFIATLVWIPKVLLMSSSTTSKTFHNFLEKFLDSNFQRLLTQQRIEWIESLAQRDLRSKHSAERCSGDACSKGSVCLYQRKSSSSKMPCTVTKLEGNLRNSTCSFLPSWGWAFFSAMDSSRWQGPRNQALTFLSQRKKRCSLSYLTACDSPRRSDESNRCGWCTGYTSVLLLSWRRHLKVAPVSQLNVSTVGCRITCGASRSLPD